MYKINKAKKGSVEDLNMLLIALLRLKRINASPVILSTKRVRHQPLRITRCCKKMNYVVCMMKMAGDTFFLDASRPMLAGFGKRYRSTVIMATHESSAIMTAGPSS